MIFNILKDIGCFFLNVFPIQFLQAIRGLINMCAPNIHTCIETTGDIQVFYKSIKLRKQKKNCDNKMTHSPYSNHYYKCIVSKKKTNERFR